MSIQEENDMNSYSIGNSVGVATGIAIGLIICIFLIKFMNRDKKLKTEYDERQEAVRGKGYTYGFWGCMAGAALVMIADCGGFVFATRFVMDFFIIFIGLIVQITYCIWNDGYYGINTNKKRFYIISIIAVLLNLLSVIGNIKGGSLIRDGLLQDAGINLMIVVLFIVIAVELIIKEKAENKEDISVESEG